MYEQAIDLAGSGREDARATLEKVTREARNFRRRNGAAGRVRMVCVHGEVRSIDYAGITDADRERQLHTALASSGIRLADDDRRRRLPTDAKRVGSIALTDADRERQLRAAEAEMAR